MAKGQVRKTKEKRKPKQDKGKKSGPASSASKPSAFSPAGVKSSGGGDKR